MNKSYKDDHVFELNETQEKTKSLTCSQDQHPNKMSQYVIISPVKNEEKFIEKTIESVINQTVPPVEYIIVNDGSTDRTPELIKKYTNKFSWIKCYDKENKKHSPGSGVVEAFYKGFEKLETRSWDFIVKLDGDLSFDKHYFEFLLNEFESNPKLGMASGVTYQPVGNNLVMDKMPGDHVRGCAKMYKRECFEAIGGLPKVLGWDTIDELRSQVCGWTTISYKDLVLIHYKPIGIKQTNIIKREFTAGERHYFLGYHPLFAISRDFYRMFQKPFVVGGILNFVGFVVAYLQKKERIEPELIEHLRKKQLERLTLKRKFW
jgi:poly-beta-1,6-N-acetyl-D-glucosamine synthase